MFCLYTAISTAQEGKPEQANGEVKAKIFSNFHTAIDGENDETAFEITRAYLGYKCDLTNGFSAEVKLDIGNPDDGGLNSKIKRYAYFKNAYLKYKKNTITLYFGLFDQLHFKLQEKYWGHRYIYKSFQDEHKFGPKADIGSSFIYSPKEWFNIDITLVNGEGYKELQTDNTYKYGMGITIKPVKGIVARFYYDIASKSITESTLSTLIGYQYKEKLVIGGEYALKSNTSFMDNHNQNGYSAYASYNLNKKIQFFGRYDNLNSNKVESGQSSWNLSKDGNEIISGMQYTITEKIRIALNYQAWFPRAAKSSLESFMYLNLEVVI